jgi:hypothetical protein
LLGSVALEGIGGRLQSHICAWAASVWQQSGSRIQR